MSERPTYYAWLRDDGTVDYSDLCAMVLPGNGGVYQIPVQVADLPKGERVVSAEELEGGSLSEPTTNEALNETGLVDETPGIRAGANAAIHLLKVYREDPKVCADDVLEEVFALLTEGRE